MSSRTAFLLGVVVLVTAATGCGSDDDKATTPMSTTEGPTSRATETTWDGQTEINFETGEITAPGFNELIDERRPTWASTARGAAEMLVDVEAETEAEVVSEGDSTVVVTVGGLADDSVEAVRYELRFGQGEDGLFRFVDGRWSQRCRPGRGHDDQFLAELCL